MSDRTPSKPSIRRVKPSDLSVGEMARRAGVAVSTLHFYESEGLISSWRTPANHRRYDRRELRRVSVIRVAQSLGISLAEVRSVLDQVPKGEAVGKEAWAQASNVWRDGSAARIALLQKLQNQLDHCMGCGCLSLEHCPLYNPADTLGDDGAGPRRWIKGDIEKTGK